MRGTPWSRIREQNSVDTEYLEIVGNGRPSGSMWKETLAVSATIWISLGKSSPSNTSPNSFMRQNERKPPRTRSPRGSWPSGRMSRWLYKDCLGGIAITHFVKTGTLQNAFLKRLRVVVGLVKSAHSHIVRLMSSRQKGLKRVMEKVQWLYWRKVIGKKENLSLMNVTIDRGNLGRGVLKSLDNHFNVDFLMHDNWVAYFRTWCRRSLFSGRALTCRDQSNVLSSQHTADGPLTLMSVAIWRRMLRVWSLWFSRPPTLWGDEVVEDQVARAIWEMPRLPVHFVKQTVEIKWKDQSERRSACRPLCGVPMRLRLESERNLRDTFPCHSSLTEFSNGM